MRCPPNTHLLAAHHLLELPLDSRHCHIRHDASVGLFASMLLLLLFSAVLLALSAVLGSPFLLLLFLVLLSLPAAVTHSSASVFVVAPCAVVVVVCNIANIVLCGSRCVNYARLLASKVGSSAGDRSGVLGSKQEARSAHTISTKAKRLNNSRFICFFI